tara:strand:+ start:3531 stop:3917 length:387 start_codon:yes stop_codon:yes gene_type:complete
MPIVVVVSARQVDVRRLVHRAEGPVTLTVTAVLVAVLVTFATALAFQRGRLVRLTWNVAQDFVNSVAVSNADQQGDHVRKTQIVVRPLVPISLAMRQAASKISKRVNKTQIVVPNLARRVIVGSHVPM